MNKLDLIETLETESGLTKTEAMIVVNLRHETLTGKPN